jgi:hypothetical protein
MLAVAATAAAQELSGLLDAGFRGITIGFQTGECGSEKFGRPVAVARIRRI